MFQKPGEDFSLYPIIYLRGLTPAIAIDFISAIVELWEMISKYYVNICKTAGK